MGVDELAVDAADECTGCSLSLSGLGERSLVRPPAPWQLSWVRKRGCFGVVWAGAGDMIQSLLKVSMEGWRLKQSQSYKRKESVITRSVRAPYRQGPGCLKSCLLCRRSEENNCHCVSLRPLLYTISSFLCPFASLAGHPSF